MEPRSAIRSFILTLLVISVLNSFYDSANVSYRAYIDAVVSYDYLLPLLSNGEEATAGRLGNHSESTQYGKMTLELGPIFYNFFVPPDAPDNALTIAKEQMFQRELSSSNESLLLYTLIGFPNISNNFCQPNCRMREFLPIGNEVDTLQAIWNYCRQDTHSHHIITYIHDKGAFHSSSSNDKARRLGTKGALECRFLLLTAERNSTGDDNLHECNACASNFNLFPQYHASSNMWTAKCSYVRELVEPKKHSALMDLMYKETLLNESAMGTYACLRPERLDANYLGLNRYAQERWVFSHPEVEPCDSLPFNTLREAPFPLRMQNWTGQLERAPRRWARGHLRRKYHRKHSYNLLAGRLYEWQYLYGKAPKNSSWIWKVNRGFETADRPWMEKCLNETGISAEDEIGTRLVRLYQPT